jgi:hypothetical protein
MLGTPDGDVPRQVVVPINRKIDLGQLYAPDVISYIRGYTLPMTVFLTQNLEIP